MLQQTQTERVVSKYSAWLERFPTIKSVADAPLNEILTLWSGLGYNRRARFLHETCKHIAREYAGIVPSDPELLDELPGIGPYTARAISTFAYETPNVFIETNIRSVYIFFFFPDTRDPVHDRELLPLIRDTLYRENPRIWYYALMDYGSALKALVKNPARKSSHYTRQSRFEGSLRQARGAIIRYLVKNVSGDRTAILREEQLDSVRLEAALDALVEEGLIRENEGIYHIGS